MTHQALTRTVVESQLRPNYEASSMQQLTSTVAQAHGWPEEELAPILQSLHQDKALHKIKHDGKNCFKVVLPSKSKPKPVRPSRARFKVRLGAAAWG